MFLLYSRSFGISAGVVAGGAFPTDAGGVLDGVVCSTAMANIGLIVNTVLKFALAIGFGLSVVSGVDGELGDTVAGAVDGVDGVEGVDGVDGVDGAFVGVSGNDGVTTGGGTASLA